MILKTNKQNEKNRTIKPKKAAAKRRVEPGPPARNMGS